MTVQQQFASLSGGLKFDGIACRMTGEARTSSPLNILITAVVDSSALFPEQPTPSADIPQHPVTLFSI